MPSYLDQHLDDLESRMNDASRRAGHQAHRAADELSAFADDVEPMVSRLTERAAEAARHSLRWMRDEGDRLRTQVARTSDRTLDYVHEAPVRSLVIAAAAGLAVYGLFCALSGRRSR